LKVSEINVETFEPDLRNLDINQNNFSIPSLFVSLLGAVALLAVVNFFRRGAAR
jgi:uncharacterized membrane protein YeaQ/YmgE (transglycosylase-associated protein family)